MTSEWLAAWSSGLPVLFEVGFMAHHTWWELT
jgi:hypothetical protein